MHEILYTTFLPIVSYPLGIFDKLEVMGPMGPFCQAIKCNVHLEIVKLPQVKFKYVLAGKAGP